MSTQAAQRVLSERETWPDLRITVQHLFPWHWRLRPRFYHDDVEPLSLITVEWLFLKVEWGANRPMFHDAARSGE